jgi:uncharacterized protein
LPERFNIIKKCSLGGSLLSRFFPHQGDFFELFDLLTAKIVEGTKCTRVLLENLGQAETYSQQLMELEHSGDEVTHRAVSLLRKTFITPFDRDDIHHLFSNLDNILDLIDATAQRIYLYDIKTLPPEAVQLGDVCIAISEHVQSAVTGLANIKKPEAILKSCVEINRLENDADRLLRGGLGKLFREEANAQQLIKVKEIFELLEETTDRCEQVAQTVERIVLEH